MGPSANTSTDRVPANLVSAQLYDSRWTASGLALASLLFYVLSLTSVGQPHGCIFPTVTTLSPLACLTLWALSVGLALMRRQGAVVVTIVGLTGVVMFLTLPLPPPPAVPGSAAVSHLRTINSAEVTYLSSVGGHYGTIPELITAGLLDSRYASSLPGYTFSIEASPDGYTATATPTSTKAGRYGYFTLADAVVRYQAEASPTCTPCFPAGHSGAPVE